MSAGGVYGKTYLPIYEDGLSRKKIYEKYIVPIENSYGWSEHFRRVIFRVVPKKFVLIKEIESEKRQLKWEIQIRRANLKQLRESNGK